MNYRQIETFDAVMKVRSISRAAELLGVTQPVVSRTIADLEHSLGFTLFERVRNRITPTPEAMLFHHDVVAHYRGMDSLRLSAARIRDRGTGQIILGAVAVLANALVPRALERFVKSHPTAEVNLSLQSSRALRDGVANGKLDMALTLDHVDTSGVHSQPFTSGKRFCVIPVEHPLAANDVIKPAHLDDVPLISFTAEMYDRQILDKLFEKSNVRPRRVVETNDAISLCGLVSRGIGVGFVCPYVLASIDQTRLVAKPFEPAIYGRTLLLLPIDRPKSLLVRDMIDCLMVAR